MFIRVLNFRSWSQLWNYFNSKIFPIYGTYIHTYIYTYVHIYICTYIHTYMHIYIHTCMHAHIHTYIHVHIHIHACTHIIYYIQYRPNNCISSCLQCFQPHSPLEFSCMKQRTSSYLSLLAVGCVLNNCSPPPTFAHLSWSTALQVTKSSVLPTH